MVYGTSTRDLKDHDWQSVARRKCETILSAIPKDWRLDPAIADRAQWFLDITEVIERFLDERSNFITRLHTKDLLSHLRDRILSAEDVVCAFCKRTALAAQLNNNVLDISIDSALLRGEAVCVEFDVGVASSPILLISLFYNYQARELDYFYHQHGHPVGPLHGLPITFKDQFHVKGMETTMGYVGWIGTFEGKRNDSRARTAESELVRELCILGAVPIAKTSVVQTLWCGETENNIVGYNLNPYNQWLSSGGSSGGQAAVQALGGSTVGFGTDIGGSVSIPAAFNGLFSIKPSSGRISFRCVANSSAGQQVIPTSVGMLGVSISCLQIVFRALQKTLPWLHDPDVVEIPWRRSKEIKRNSCTVQSLCFGIFANDGIVIPHPPVQRAIRLVEKALIKRGYKMIKWCPPSHAEASRLLHHFTGADGGWDVFKNVALSGEPLIKQLHGDFGSQPDSPMPLLEYHEHTVELKEFRLKYQDYWNSTDACSGTGRPVDAVILPVAPHAAVIPGKWFHYQYGSIANVLDYTTVVIPVTKACRHLDPFDGGYRPLNDIDRQNWLAYDPEIYDGAPAAVQILGRRFDEEKLLSIAQLVVDALELTASDDCSTYAIMS